MSLAPFFVASKILCLEVFSLGFSEAPLQARDGMKKKFLVLSLVVLVSFNGIYAENLSIFGTIQNGTTGGKGKADSIRMLALQGAMLPLAEIGPQEGQFRFPKMELPDGAPILLQIQYQGVNYNKMIPPTTQFRTSPQEVVVYESGGKRNQISIKSLMQVMREKKGLRVFKLFLLDNSSKPPRSFFEKGNEIEYYVPENAIEVFSQIQQPGSKMAIPLSAVPGNSGGKILDRALLPGVSELQVSYLVPGNESIIEERLLVESESGKFPVFVKPKEMELKTKSKVGIQKLTNDVPQGLSAYVLDPVPFGTQVSLSFEGGKPLPSIANSKNPEILNGSILTTWDLSLFGVIGFLGLLFTLSFLFVYKNSKKGPSQL